MAWPLTPLTTYVANSLPAIKAFDLNKIQGAINDIVGGNVSLAAVQVDAVGGNALTFSAADSYADFFSATVPVGTRKLIWQGFCDAVHFIIARIYVYNGGGGNNSAWEATVNAWWDPGASHWNYDSSNPNASTMLRLTAADTSLVRPMELFSHQTSSGTGWTDGAWDQVFTFSEQGMTSGVIATDAIGHDSNPTMGQAVYGSSTFRTAFISTPSTVTIGSNNAALNVGAVTQLTALTKYSTMVSANASATNPAYYSTQIAVS